LITRGEGLPPDNAKRRNSFAAIRSRLGDNMNPIGSVASAHLVGWRHEILPAALVPQAPI
jgi:hypothetical protein